ncbi:histone-lysine N-methyltransferase SETDB1-A isoform X3 [Hippoglossus hippoglossus]|uniref:histone-lysine N-methyltransferase SETDB1-A isoform X3 n=1 Tax=Hippoglossus hippoglossus TaxID=8267 RepID=UPI00148D4430|nr:histone-lysine N-methyltransferase SETDB1-A isoform X3 [Hippoglossus hippoglossus]
MEEDETMMSKEELREWIRAKVKKNGLLPPDMLQKRYELQSLLERRQTMDANLLKLQESVASCEAIVRKQYSLLGWEYRDTDSDDDESSGGGSGHIPPSPCESVQSGTQARLSPAVTGHSPLLPKQRGSKNPQRSRKRFQMKEPVVVLTRLPEWQIRDLRPPTPPMSTSDDESLSDSDSDDQWEPEIESSDSQCQSYNSGSKKRRKIDQVSKKKQVTGHERDQADTKTDADSDAAKTLKPQAKEPENTEHEQGEKTPTKESSPPANTKGVSSACVVTAFCQSDDATKDPPSVPQAELSVNMKVLARRRPMIWQPGKIAEIQTKEDGKMKYKVNFVEKGKSLVSAHHIALEQVPSVEQLFVGARVVIKCKVDQNSYSPGVLAELPSRKNKMRFLVFIDDHTPIYVPLHGIHLVCRPLSHPLDDIPDATHKNFMKGYLNSWPNPLLTHYPQGEIVQAEHNGVQKKCEVVMVDSSLIHVLFQEDQHKEWIYRGSMRLKHMINMRKQLESEKVTSKQSTSSDHK